MRVSQGKRAFLVGRLVGQAIGAVVELFYQERTALGFVTGLLQEVERLQQKRQKSHALMLKRERIRRKQKTPGSRKDPMGL
ncbi:MAG: hypothetical protein WC518_03885 [Patescibacteria group bacterium]